MRKVWLAFVVGFLVVGCRAAPINAIPDRYNSIEYSISSAGNAFVVRSKWEMLFAAQPSRSEYLLPPANQKTRKYRSFSARVVLNDLSTRALNVVDRIKTAREVDGTQYALSQPTIDLSDLQSGERVIVEFELEFHGKDMRALLPNGIVERAKIVVSSDGFPVSVRAFGLKPISEKQGVFNESSEFEIDRSDANDTSTGQMAIRGVSASRYSSWEEVAKDVSSGYRTSLPATSLTAEALDYVGTGVIESTSGTERSIAVTYALSDWISKNFHYAATPLSVANSSKPRTWASISKTRSGDCKDLAFVMIGLLQLAGIEAEPVYVPGIASTNLPKRHDLPGLALFDHVIVYVPSSGKYIDPTMGAQSATSDFSDVYTNISGLHIFSEKYRSITADRLNSDLEIYTRIFRSGKQWRGETLFKASGSSLRSVAGLLESLKQHVRKHTSPPAFARSGYLLDEGSVSSKVDPVGNGIKGSFQFQLSEDLFDSHQKLRVVPKSYGHILLQFEGESPTGNAPNCWFRSSATEIVELDDVVYPSDMPLAERVTETSEFAVFTQEISQIDGRTTTRRTLRINDQRNECRPDEVEHRNVFYRAIAKIRGS